MFDKKFEMQTQSVENAITNIIQSMLARGGAELFYDTTLCWSANKIEMPSENTQYFRVHIFVLGFLRSQRRSVMSWTEQENIEQGRGVSSLLVKIVPNDQHWF